MKFGVRIITQNVDRFIEQAVKGGTGDAGLLTQERDGQLLRLPVEEDPFGSCNKFFDRAIRSPVVDNMVHGNFSSLISVSLLL